MNFYLSSQEPLAESSDQPFSVRSADGRLCQYTKLEDCATAERAKFEEECAAAYLDRALERAVYDFFGEQEGFPAWERIKGPR